MSMVLIGHDFPDSCSDCACCHCDSLCRSEYFCCALDDASDIPDINAGRLPNCPARPLPKTHGKLIDVNELAKLLIDDDNVDIPIFAVILDLIHAMPAVIEAEIPDPNEEEEP